MDLIVTAATSVASVIGAILALVVVLGPLVVIHEWGHFYAARRFGITVEVFSVGFGRCLWRRTDKHGTEFRVCLIPLGGYCRMQGEEASYRSQVAEGDPAESTEEPARPKGKAWTEVSRFARVIVLAAGPVANLVAAIVILWPVELTSRDVLRAVVEDVQPASAAQAAGLQSGDEIVSINESPIEGLPAFEPFMLGYIGYSGALDVQVKRSGLVRDLTIELDQFLHAADDLSASRALGINWTFPSASLEIARVTQSIPASPAESAGIQEGDVIDGVDGVTIRSWNQFTEIVGASPERELSIVVVRDGARLTLSAVPMLRDINGTSRGFLGVSPLVGEIPPELALRIDRNPIEALNTAVSRTGEMTVLTVKSVWQLITGTVNADNLHGPVWIASTAQRLSASLIALATFAAAISIAIGIFNLLPLPILDGGQIVFAAIESVMRRPLPPTIVGVFNIAGLLLVGVLMLVALRNDIVTLIS